MTENIQVDRKAYKHEWYLKNRDTSIERSKAWRLKNLEQFNKLRREWEARNQEKVCLIRRKARWKRLGILLEVKDYNELLVQQNGLCAICEESPKGRKLAVDHNHKTGQVRGLLCSRCNIGLGWLELMDEDFNWARRIQAYRESSKIE